MYIPPCSSLYIPDSLDIFISSSKQHLSKQQFLKHLKIEGLQSWVSEHKLTSIGTIWATAVGASLAYTSSKRAPFKPSMRLIHARMHAQALTLVMLSGAALYHHFGTSEKAYHHDHRN
ncbi:putative hypoxia induced protein, domain-containing protein [Tanacetum coccineum]